MPLVSKTPYNQKFNRTYIAYGPIVLKQTIFKIQEKPNSYSLSDENWNVWHLRIQLSNEFERNIWNEKNDLNSTCFYLLSINLFQQLTSINCRMLLLESVVIQTALCTMTFSRSFTSALNSSYDTTKSFPGTFTLLW